MKPMDFHQAVARQFNKAAKDYHRHAYIQRVTASTLLNLGPADTTTVLDVGCGPASTTGCLLPQVHRYIGIDIAPAMLLTASVKYPQLTWLNGSWDALPVADNSIDWLFANLSLQWARDLKQAVSEAYRVTKPGGMVTVNTVVGGTFNSFIKSWQAVDNLQHTHTFHSAEKVKQDVAVRNWCCMDFSLEKYTQYFTSARELIGSIKGVGANHVNRTKNTGLMTRNRLQQFENAFEYYRTTQGLPLEWSILNIKLIK